MPPTENTHTHGLLTREDVIIHAQVSPTAFDSYRRRGLVRAVRNGPHGRKLYDLSAVQAVRDAVAAAQAHEHPLLRITRLEAEVQSLKAQIGAITASLNLPARPAGHAPLGGLSAALDTMVDAAAGEAAVPRSRARAAVLLLSTVDSADWARLRGARPDVLRPWVVVLMGLRALLGTLPSYDIRVAMDRVRVTGLEALYALPEEDLSLDEKLILQ